VKAAYYLDTSAALKLVKLEAETPFLEAWLEAQHFPRLISSDLLRTELIGNILRFVPEGLQRAHDLIEQISFLKIKTEICTQAVMHVGLGLGTLDAIHLASALACSPEIQGLVTYDKRLIEASLRAGIRPITPIV
jgi:hypothetical protein